jgi:3-keto-5-aminohexanoate cleavage enzyme
MMSANKAIITCALTGIITDPEAFTHIPVTPEEMADAAEQAFNAGASIAHTHFRSQGTGMTDAHAHFRSQEAGMTDNSFNNLITWDLKPVGEILAAIKARVPEMIICMSTGIMGPDISGPVACLKRYKPEMAACNAGTLNYLKIRKDGSWAWPPHIFANPVEKVKAFLDVMKENKVVPEFECFDTGIVRCVGLYKKNGMFDGPAHISCVMGVASGMPSNPDLIPILVKEMPEGSHWQVIVIGRSEVWKLHRKALESGSNARTGLEDTFYLPSGKKARNNGELVDALVKIAKEVGREIASPAEAREIINMSNTTII